jgi:hypothetical protein
MHALRKSIQVLVAFAALTICGVTPPMEDYAVRKGQTVSFIAFQKYGAYNDSIAALLQADNPQIADLDLVGVGQILRLRKDQKAPVAAEMDPQRRILMASRKAVVTMAQGSGEIRRAEGGREPLAANRFLTTGDSILTGADGLAEIIVDNQSVLRLAPGTEVRLTAIQEPRKQTASDRRTLLTRFSLLHGKTWTKVQKWAGSMIAFQVQMPNAIAGVHGTVFENAIAADSSSSVSVYQGEVGVQGGADPIVHRSLAPNPIAGPKEISAAQWMKILKDGQRLDISKSGAAGQTAQFNPDPSSAWVKMNQERDSLCD